MPWASTTQIMTGSWSRIDDPGDAEAGANDGGEGVMDEATLKIRRDALEMAIRVVESLSFVGFDNGTGHYSAGWREAHREVLEALRERIAQEEPGLVLEYGMPNDPEPPRFKPRAA